MKKYIMIVAVLVAASVRVQAEVFPPAVAAGIKRALTQNGSGKGLTSGQADCVVRKIQGRMTFDQFVVQMQDSGDGLTPPMQRIAMECVMETYGQD